MTFFIIRISQVIDRFAIMTVYQVISEHSGYLDAITALEKYKQYYPDTHVVIAEGFERNVS